MEHDLTSRQSPYLDPHMLLPMLDFLAEKDLFSPESIKRQKLRVLTSSNMAEYAVQVHESELGEQPPAALEEEVVAMEAKNDENEAKMEALQQVFTASAGGGAGPVTHAQIDEYRMCAKVSFEFGDYAKSLGALSQIEEVMKAQGLGTLGHPKVLSLLWGKLAASILLGSWDAARHELEQLSLGLLEAEKHMSDAHVLEARSWLLHWALFVVFKVRRGHDFLVDFCVPKDTDDKDRKRDNVDDRRRRDMRTRERNLQAIRNNCPWLLRYVATAVVMGVGRQSQFDELLRIIAQEKHAYSDPVTEFLECLRVDFDFEGAQQKLKECEKVLRNDYFLADAADKFMGAARIVTFETFCRIHRTLPIPILADRLAMPAEDAEKWIVDLIRGSSLDARIDSANNCVVIGGNKGRGSVHASVQERTKDLTIRSLMLSTNLQRLALDEERERRRKALAAEDEE